MRIFIPVLFPVVILAGAAGVAGAASQGFTIFNAIDQAVTTNPGVGEAAANKRATEAELRQNQGTLLPQVRLEARQGRTKWDFVAAPPLCATGCRNCADRSRWRPAEKTSIPLRQSASAGRELALFLRTCQRALLLLRPD